MKLHPDGTTADRPGAPRGRAPRVTVLGGAITNVVFAWPKRHPHADRPLIDWDLILVMQPMQLVGALILPVELGAQPRA